LLYLQKDEFDESLKAFSKSETIRMENDESNLSHTIIDKSRVYIKKELYTEAIILTKLGIDLATRYNDNNYLLKGYYQLIEIYEKLDKNEDIEVVVRPEDIKMVKPEEGMLKGKVISSVFKGVHYEMELDENGRTWLIQNTKNAEIGTELGMDIYPEDIHIMKKVRS